MPSSRVSQQSRRSLFRALGIFAGVWAVLVTSVFIVSAQRNGRLDGRININPINNGGSSVYCVDQFYRPSAWYATGGIRVLSPSGQEELFVTDDVIDRVDVPAVDTLLGTGASVWGPMELYRQPDRNFRLTGFDEFGKQWVMIWNGCGFIEAVPTLPPVIIPPVIPPEVTPEATPEVCNPEDLDCYCEENPEDEICDGGEIILCKVEDFECLCEAGFLEYCPA